MRMESFMAVLSERHMYASLVVADGDLTSVAYVGRDECPREPFRQTRPKPPIL